MSITEVRIDRISKEEKYYRQKTEQYLADHSDTETTVKYKWKRTIQSIIYQDLEEYRSSSRGKVERIVGTFINPTEYETPDDALDAAQKQAVADRNQHHSSVSFSTSGSKIEFEVYIGDEPPQRGKVYRPGENIPEQRVIFWRYTYEIIQSDNSISTRRNSAVYI